MIDDGIFIFFNDALFSKRQEEIEVIEEGINISLSGQPSKAFTSISVTDDGIEICSNDSHLKNALYLI